MDELRQLRAAGAPFFLAIQTYWSHRPFLSQNGAKVDGEERVIREADSEIGAFYDELLKSGFLGEGLVFITGDHRAMEPPTSEGEKLRFGSSWVSRIPGVVASRAVQLPKVIEADFQQSDVAASFESLVLPQYCVGELEGSFLATPPSPSPCILHAKGDDRDLVLVKCGPHDAVVRLDGDRTGIESGRVPNQTRLIQLINRTRIRDRSR